MIDYLVDENFDVVLPLQKVTDKSTLLFQQVRLILNTWTKEFPYDILMGIAYEEKVIGTSNIDVTEIEIEYFSKISVLQYFQSMDNFSIETTAQREILISFSVTSTDGSTETFTQVV